MAFFHVLTSPVTVVCTPKHLILYDMPCADCDSTVAYLGIRESLHTAGIHSWCLSVNTTYQVLRVTTCVLGVCCRWLDQLKPQQQQQQQIDNGSSLNDQQHVRQEISQLYVPHHHVVPRQQSDTGAPEALSLAAAAGRSAGRPRAGERQQENPSHHLAAAAAAADNSSSRLSNTGYVQPWN